MQFSLIALVSLLAVATATPLAGQGVETGQIMERDESGILVARKTCSWMCAPSVSFLFFWS
jgi:hypothetical protein